MVDPGARLARAFDFDATDLAANRRGVLSPRQRAIRQTGRVAMRLAFAVFAAVVLGAAGLVAVPALRGGAGGATAGAAGGLVWAVAAAAIAIGWLAVRPALAGARARTIRVASGRAEPARTGAPAGRRVRLGATVLPVLTDDQLAAFVPGVDYRVWYLQGRPVPTILSAEVIGAHVLPPGAPAAIPTDPAGDRRLRTIRRGMLLVVAIGALALAIPVLGAVADRWAAPWRAALWVGLLAVAIGLVPFARRWLAPGARGAGDH
jgi:hypothetical protein